MAPFKRQLRDDRNIWEKMLFRYIKSKDIEQTERLLQEHKDQISLEQKDLQGYTCLEAAVLSKNEEALLLILNMKTCPPVDDALVLAMRMKYDSITDIILEYLTTSESLEDDSESDYIDISMMKASVKENRLSLDDDDDIESDYAYVEPKIDAKFGYLRTKYAMEEDADVRPFKASRLDVTVNWKKILCEACIAGRLKTVEKFLVSELRLPTIKETLAMSSDDQLKDFSERLEIWKAITSPVYLYLATQDPVISAFKMNTKMLKLSQRFPEHQNELNTLAMNSEQFAVDLLSLCETQKDVCQILSLDYNANMPFAQIKYKRLLEALDHKQKLFISHPNCQTFVNNLWTDGLVRWREWNLLHKILYTTVHAVSMPFVAVVTAVGGTCLPVTKIPLNRFIYSATSYLIFLLLLTLYLMLDLSRNQQLQVSLYLCAFVVTALLRLLVSDLPMHGFSMFLDTFWKMYELIMYSVFLGGFACVICAQALEHPLVLEIGKAVLSLASIAAFVRLFNWFHIHPSLGPFIIAFKQILFIVCRLLGIFVIIFFAFAFSLHFLYKDKIDADLPSEDHELVFGRLSSTFSALFWAMYGHGEASFSAIPPNNSTDESTILITEYTGTVLWGWFHVACIIVLINMLIAIMTETFERIHGDCDREWKFARTKLQVYYFEDCSIVPEPFNILYYLRNFPLWICKTVKKMHTKRKQEKRLEPENNSCNDIETSIQVNLNFTMQESSKKPESDETDKQNNEYQELIDRLMIEFNKRNFVKATVEQIIR